MLEPKLPSNIRQIGSISEGIKVYIEDFVYTYLKQYARAGKNCEKSGFLIGRQLIIDGEETLFVCGAVQGRGCVNEDGAGVFGPASYEYAEEQIDKHFRGFEIVGWMRSQPGFGTRLNPVCQQVHLSNFYKKHHVLFIIDPAEDVDAFYSWNDGMDALEEKTGYFIYYDKNNGMQEYMSQDKPIKLKSRDRAAPPEAAAAVMPGKKPAPVYTTYTSRNQSIAGASARKGAKPGGPYGYDQSGRKLTNMLVTLSSVLFVICFIMGAGLIQNESRISELENRADDLDTKYVFLQSSQAAFAAENAAREESAAPAETETPAPAPSETPTPAAPLPPLTIQTQIPTAPPQTAAPETEPPPAETGEPEFEDEPAFEETFGGIPETYVIQEGDSLYEISRSIYGTVGMIDLILRENDMTDPDRIMTGQVLKLPKP